MNSVVRVDAEPKVPYAYGELSRDESETMIRARL
jgi:hypothetical protein